MFLMKTVEMPLNHFLKLLFRVKSGVICSLPLNHIIPTPPHRKNKTKKIPSMPRVKNGVICSLLFMH